MPTKNLIFSSLFMLVWTLNYVAQSQKLNRRILHTLSENEILHYDEALIQTNVTTGSNFCLVIEDTVKSTKSFVYNEKKVLEIKPDDWLMINTGSIDLNNPNGFVLDYTVDNKSYINLYGNVFGPFETAKSLYCSETNEVGYYYKLGDKYYFKVNNQKYGPFLGDHNSIYLHDTKRIFNYEYEANYSAVVDGKDYLEVIDEKKLILNGETINSNHYDIRWIFSLAYLSKDKFGYLSEKNSNGTCDIWINGSLVDNYDFRPYSTDKFILTNTDFYFTSDFNNEIYKNGNPIYKNVSNMLDINEDGDILYYDRDNIIYLNDKILFNAGESSVIDGVVHSKNHYAYTFAENEDYFINSTSGNFGPCNYIKKIKFSKGGKLSYLFSKDYSNQTYEDGQISLKSDSPDFYSVHNYESIKFDDHSFESSYKYDYVVIDGEPYGKSPALQFWINHQNNTFNWSALEKNEYVLYSYSFK